MIPITPNLAIAENEIEERFIRSPGPGGQNVNKVSSAVQLRFDVRGSPSLPPSVRDRLTVLAGRRISREGVLTVTANRHRSQERNRADALERLVELIRQATIVPTIRRATRVPRAAKRNRLDSKTKRGTVKRMRRVETDE
jgi:ribosome-associated protein